MEQGICGALCSRGRQAADHDHFGTNLATFQFLQNADPVHLWHLEVECDDVRLKVNDFLKCHLAVGGVEGHEQGARQAQAAGQVSAPAAHQ